MSESIVLASVIYKFTLNKIPFVIEYFPKGDYVFTASARDRSNVIQSSASNNLIITLDKLFELVK